MTHTPHTVGPLLLEAWLPILGGAALERARNVAQGLSVVESWPEAIQYLRSSIYILGREDYGYRVTYDIVVDCVSQAVRAMTKAGVQLPLSLG